MRMKTVAQALSWARIGLGLAFVAAPGPLVRFWTATEQSGLETDMMARGLGARDALIGAGGLLALRRGQPASYWLAAGAVADAADAALTLGVLRRPPKALRLALVGVTVSSALAFAWMARLVE